MTRSMILWAALCGSASAQDAVPLRVVVVPKVTADGQDRDAAPLEAWVHEALKSGGHRVVDLDSSMRAQAFALSDSVAAGRVPEELSVLNADAAWAVQLSCERDVAGNAAVMGLTFYCTFTRKVVRIGQGDTVHTASAEWNDVFGSNFGQALFGGNVKKRAPGLLASDVTALAAAWKPTGPWDVDLKVTGLTERGQADAIAARLKELPGITAARVTAFTTGVSQLSLRGEGADALAHLGEHIEGDAGLGLRITHEADRLVHAAVDVGALHRRGVHLQWKGPKSPAPKSEAAVIAARGPTLAQSAMANLPWVEVTGVGTASPKDAAKAAEEPYFAVVSLDSAVEGGATRWLSTAALVGTASGSEILAGSGRDPDPLVALAQAVQALDAKFVAALGDAGRRRQLGLPESIGDSLAREPVRIATLELDALFPARAKDAERQGIGRLVVANDGKAPITGATAEIRAGDEVIATLALPEVPAGGSAEVAIRLTSRPTVDPDTQHTLPVVALVSWALDGAYGRTRSYSSLVVHRRNTLDWTVPESVAAFVDPTDSTVRTLATGALAKLGTPEGSTPALTRAAAVHAGVWGEPLKYVADPVTTSFADSIDEVQHPGQTLARGTGDCDDLTVLLASLYESVGLSTVVLTTPGHVLVGVDSGLHSGGELLVGLPRDRFVEVDGALFVPLETTALKADFAEAWTRGADLLAKAGTWEAFRTRDAWRRFPTVSGTGNGDSGAFTPKPRALAALPKLKVPKSPPSPADPLAGAVLAWLDGNRKAGLQQSLAACEKRVGEACYNLAVMFATTATGDEDTQVDAQLQAALATLPPPVMQMLLDDQGGGRADDKSEDSEEAEIRERLEEVLRKARELQEKLKSEGAVTEQPLQTEAMAGRRGAPVGEEVELAPLFFYARAKVP
ncbi:MAG: hypothetical protein R3F61_29975 [Myxococcota bacterium]